MLSCPINRACTNHTKQEDEDSKPVDDQAPCSQRVLLRHESREWRKGIASPRPNSNRLLIICYRPFHPALCHSLLFWCLQALFESSCEIDHLSGRRSFGRSLDFLALRFRIDHFFDLLGVGVLVFLRIELIGKALDQFEPNIYPPLSNFLIFLSSQPTGS